MEEDIRSFKTLCSDAFQYLLDDYEFVELSDPHPEHSNPFQARFKSGVVELLILGEGYGTLASIQYITEDGTHVATEILEPDWKPLEKIRSRKKQRGPEGSQQDQVYAAAKRIKERDEDILRGNMDRLNAAAVRWRTICGKMGWK